VTGTAGAENISLQDWQWVIDIKLMGVVHGVKAFLPLLRTHVEGGHIVNTASMAGFLSDTGFGAYTASKFAVVGISEAPGARFKRNKRDPPRAQPRQKANSVPRRPAIVAAFADTGSISWVTFDHNPYLQWFPSFPGEARGSLKTVIVTRLALQRSEYVK
jgi:short chain dehydrogenase